MNKEKDFFKTCFNTVASLEVKNESQAIAKEVILSEIENLQQENKQLQKQITVMKEYFELIIDLSFDYDGCNTVESLKSLIDDLKKYAKLGREGNLTEPIYTNDNDSYNILHQKLESEIK